VPFSHRDPQRNDFDMLVFWCHLLIFIIDCIVQKLPANDVTLDIYTYYRYFCGDVLLFVRAIFGKGTLLFSIPSKLKT
jgi:hypothetical protein